MKNICKVLGMSALIFIYTSCQDESKDKAASLTQASDFPGIGRANAVTFTIASKGYLCLGNGDLNVAYNDVWEFDPSTKVWQRKADFPGE